MASVRCKSLSLEASIDPCQIRIPPRTRNGADFIFNRSGAPGVKREWWYHIASGVWFMAERDTLKDEIIRTYLYEEIQDHE